MEALKQLLLNVDTLIDEDELALRLQGGAKLNIKLGIDPTRPDITFGHWVVFNKLRQFQDLGHHCILLIGDYTASIGDPSGRSETRPVLSAETIEANTATYLQQAFKILDAAKTQVRRNSEWFGAMNFSDCLALARSSTVAQMLERDDFSKRYKSKTPISIVEFLYPLVQAYDSVMLKADVELGGTDQLFNLILGRQLQKEHGQTPQIAMTLPLLVGLDGQKKMSKSTDNYIAFNDTAENMFGKIMSVDDSAMWAYYRLILMLPEAEIKARKALHPMLAKKQLGLAILTKFFDEFEAQAQLARFEKVFSEKKQPEEMPEFQWSSLTQSPEIEIIELMHPTNLFESKKAIRRLIEQKAVRVDGILLEDTKAKFNRPKNAYVIQAGRRKFSVFGLNARG